MWNIMCLPVLLSQSAAPKSASLTMVSGQPHPLTNLDLLSHNVHILHLIKFSWGCLVLKFSPPRCFRSGKAGRSRSCWVGWTPGSRGCGPWAERKGCFRSLTLRCFFHSNGSHIYLSLLFFNLFSQGPQFEDFCYTLKQSLKTYRTLTLNKSLNYVKSKAP